MKKYGIALLIFNMVWGTQSFAQNESSINHGHKGLTIAPAPTSCISSAFSKTGNENWWTISLKLTNNCGKDVDFQNVTVNFNSTDNISTTFWGDFGPLTYPDNPLNITSQANPGGIFTASFYLHIPENPWSNSILHDKQSITITYGNSSAGYDADSVKVFLSGGPAEVGQLSLTNSTAKPADVTQNYAVVNVTFNGQKINSTQVPWGGTSTVNNLVPGNYVVQPEVVSGAQSTYEGIAKPSTVTIVANQKASSTIAYSKIAQLGQINVAAPSKPAALGSFPGQPSVVATRVDTNASVTQTIPWGATTAFSKLDNGVTYKFSTPAITFNSATCVGSFAPSSLVASAANPPTTQLTYQCSSVSSTKISISVSGVPCDVSSITVAFQPSDGSAKITKAVAISQGIGNDVVNLMEGVVYNVSATNIPSYTTLFNPQPVTGKPGVVEHISYEAQPPGLLNAKHRQLCLK